MQKNTIYSIPREQADITRFVWVALGIMWLITLLSMTASTQYRAWKFMYAGELGGKIADKVYWPFMCLV